MRREFANDDVEQQAHGKRDHEVHDVVIGCRANREHDQTAHEGRERRDGQNADTTAKRLIAHAGVDDHAHGHVMDANAEGEQERGRDRLGRHAVHGHTLDDVVDREGDHHGDAHVQRATMRMPGNHGRVSEVMCIVILDMTVSSMLAVIGIRQEAVERRECREAQHHGNHSEKPADVLDTLEYLGHEVKREQHDDGAEGDGHRKLAHAMLVLGKAGNGRAYQHEDAEHECDEKPHACPSCPAFHAAHMAALATSHITPAKSHFGAMLVSNIQEGYSVANQINQRGRETTWTR